MTYHIPGISARIRRGGLGTAALAAVLALPLAGCNIDDLVRTKQPDIVFPEQISSKSALPNVLAGAIGDFQVAFSGTSGTEGQILYSGLLADEFYITDTFGTRIEMDQRNIADNNSNNLTVFSNLAGARRATEAAAVAYRTLAGQRASAGDSTTFANGGAEALALAGFSYILFAENYCSGVPFSEALPDGTIVPGDPLTKTEMLRRALQRFASADSALNIKSNTSASIRNLVRIGRGRAYLDLATQANRATLFDSAAAAVGNVATAASTVPIGYTYQIFHSENSGRENNSVWSFNNSQVRFSVADAEGTNGLAFRAAFVNGVDVRTAWSGPTTGFDNGTTYLNQKYPERKANVVLASGAEARYIMAENYLAKGDVANYLKMINEVRDAYQTYNQCYPLAVLNNVCQNPVASPGPLPDPALSLAATATPTDSANARVNMLFRERALTMWITSHRLGDLRRLIYQYGRQQDQVFPTGAFVRATVSRTYGTDVSFPVPVEERNNKKFQSCDNSIA